MSHNKGSCPSEITAPDFVERMDQWWESVGHRKEWSTTIPTKLSHFVYWCTRTATASHIEVNSTVWRGAYYNACEEFEEYMRETEESGDFEYGYPFSVERREDCVWVGSWFDDHSVAVEFPLSHTHSASEFLTLFAGNLVFQWHPSEGTGGGEYEGTLYFRDSLKPEITGLFLSL
jgi:hypothetical protein